MEPTPATEVEAAARGAAAAGAAAFTDSTATAGAAATGALLLDAAGITASEGVKVVTVRGVATAVVAASLAEPALPADGTDTAGVSLWARRGLAAADEDAPLREVEVFSAELDESAAPAPLPERRGEVALVDEVEVPLDA
ncbi:MAG: hypothetical protein ACOYB7_17510 [Mycobacterium sp.]